MLSTPQIIQTKVQEAAIIHLAIPRSEMMNVFAPAVGELMAALAEQGVEPVGAVFAHHLKMTPDTFDFELGVKVSSPVKAAGRVKPGQLPAARVARTVYNGPYEGLPSAWAEFDTWMRKNGHEQAETLWELYTVGPQSSTDPANWHTELNRPLISKTATFAEGRDLILTRTFDAPREKLFRAWTDPALLKQWFAPLPWTTPIVENDVRVGGATFFVMRSPEGEEIPNHGVYLEVVDNERLGAIPEFG